MLSVYFTAGYPHRDDTAAVIKELAAAGADMIEVGIPFSDPMADGPVIQHSNTVALNEGITLAVIFEQLKDIRRDVDIPLVMMGYLNPVMQYGVEKFCADCKAVGIDGVIIPDLPLGDYMRDFRSIGLRYGIDFIMLVTPETSEERIRLIDENTTGFIYMVSAASTTGARDTFDEMTLAYFRRIDAMGLRNPRLIGFGISNKSTFDAASAHSGGAIIGSEFIKLLGTEPSVKEAVSALMKKIGRQHAPQSR